MALDYKKAIEIDPGTYWVGYNFEQLYWHTNPYLILDDEEAVLIDPGSPVDFEKVYNKIQSVTDVNNINYIILHHQDPDLCGSVAEFEKRINHPITIYNPKRSAVFMKHYGINSFVVPIEPRAEDLVLKSGRVIKFFHTPYCHAPGSMVTYDTKSKILFSSDIFGAFNIKWELYEDMIPNHLETVKAFMEPYMGSKEAMLAVADTLDKLDIKMICPQHGSIIRKNIKKWISNLREMEYGKALKEKTGLEIRTKIK